MTSDAERSSAEDLEDEWERASFAAFDAAEGAALELIECNAWRSRDVIVGLDELLVELRYMPPSFPGFVYEPADVASLRTSVRHLNEQLGGVDGTAALLGQLTEAGASANTVLQRLDEALNRADGNGLVSDSIDDVWDEMDDGDLGSAWLPGALHELKVPVGARDEILEDYDDGEIGRALAIREIRNALARVRLPRWKRPLARWLVR